MFLINRIIYTLLQFSWGIIQNIIGLIIFVYVNLTYKKRDVFYYHGAIVSRWKYSHSMGCGLWIFLGESYKNEEAILVHEYGHTIQSIILGPLFILLIAIPSILWSTIPKFVMLRKTRGMHYTDLYCEKWANSLGEEVIKKRPIGY